MKIFANINVITDVFPEYMKNSQNSTRTSNKILDKRHEKTLYRRRCVDASTHMKRYSKWLVIREVQITTKCSEVLKANGALKPTDKNTEWHNHLEKEFDSFL